MWKNWIFPLFLLPWDVYYPTASQLMIRFECKEYQIRDIPPLLYLEFLPSSHGNGIHSVHSFSFAWKHIHEKLQRPWISVDIPQNFYTFYTPQKFTLFDIPRNFYKKPPQHPFWDSSCIKKWHWSVEFERKRGFGRHLLYTFPEINIYFCSFCWRHSQKDTVSVLRTSTPLETRRC